MSVSWATKVPKGFKLPPPDVQNHFKTYKAAKAQQSVFGYCFGNGKTRCLKTEDGFDIYLKY
jgi:hypothetical protein